MIRVLRIMHRLSISGPTLHAYFLSEHLDSRFHTKILSGQLSHGEASPEFILRKMKFPVEYLDSMEREINFLKDWRSLQEIRKIIRTYKPHIVHTHAAKSGALGRIAAWLEGVPIIVHTYHGHVFHSYFGFLKTKFFIGLEKMLSRISNGIITISERQFSEIVNDLRVTPPKITHVIPLGFDFDRFEDEGGKKRMAFRQEFGLGEDEIALCLAGRITAIKNHQMFLESLKQVFKLYPKGVFAFIVGDGELREALESFCKMNDLPIGISDERKSAVVFTSWRSDMPEVFNGIDICCLTSLNEGTPVTAIEAMFCQKPVVSTDVGGVADVVEDGKSGILTPSQDPSAFSNAIITLIENLPLRRQMGIAARKKAQEFDVKKLIKSITELYDLLLEKKGIKE